MRGKLLTGQMKRIALFKTVSRRDAGAEPTWMYLRRVLNRAILFIRFSKNRVEMRISSQKYEVGEFDD